MLKKIALAFVIAVVGLLGYATTRPDEMNVVRSLEMAARPDAAYSQIEDFHHWTKWSPWDELDPNQKKTYEGEPRGKGAITGWSGNDDVGEGRMTITDTAAPNRIDIDLEFIRPFESRSKVTFTVDAAGAGSKVTWAMNGKNAFMEKVVGIFMDFETMVGKDFEKGLGKLKVAAEAAEAELAMAEAKAKEEEAARAAAQAALVPVDGTAPAAEGASAPTATP